MQIAVPKNSRLHLCGKVALVSGAHVGQRQQHIGPVGLMLKMIRDRHPAVVDIVLDALRRPEESMTIRTVANPRHSGRRSVPATCGVCGVVEYRFR